MSWLIRPILTLLLGSALAWGLVLDEAQAQAPTDSSATTEHSCSFGMAKGDPTHQCQVPIPAGCVVARFPGDVPPEAKLVVEDGASSSASHTMSRSLEDPTFAGRVESVVKDLSYHVEFKGASSPSYRVRVFENPELTRTDANLEFPAYTAMEPRTTEDVRHVSALEGTKLALQFRLNKEVASAKLVDEAGKEIDLVPPAEPGPPVYTTAFTLEDSHRYKVRLVDREGRTNKLAADLGVNVTRNRPPTIAMSQPGHDVRVSPVEELRLKAQASDDASAISSRARAKRRNSSGCGSYRGSRRRHSSHRYRPASRLSPTSALACPPASAWLNCASSPRST